MIGQTYQLRIRDAEDAPILLKKRRRHTLQKILLYLILCDGLVEKLHLFRHDQNHTSQTEVLIRDREQSRAHLK